MRSLFSSVVATSALMAACGLAQATTVGSVDVGDIGAIPVAPYGTSTFSGFCTDCGENTAASATLSRAAGGPPFFFDQWNFEYHSALFDLTSEWVEVGRVGTPNASNFALAYILFGALIGNDVHTFEFASDEAGRWALNDMTLTVTADEDQGRLGTWRTQAVPEPATIALMALALGVAGWQRQTRRD